MATMIDTCENCGAGYGLHHDETEQCPLFGREAPIGERQEYEETVFRAFADEDNSSVMRDRLAQQLTGFFHAQSGYSLGDLLTAADASVDELVKLESDGELTFLSDKEFAEICSEIGMRNTRL